MKWGGTEKHVIALASGMQARGHRVKILALFRPGLLADEVKKNGIAWECLDLPYRWDARTSKTIFGWLGRNPTDIVHLYLFGFDFFAAAPARLKKIPGVLSTRREIPAWQKIRHRMLVNLSNCFADKVICCSKAVQSWTLQNEWFVSPKVVTIYNGVDLRRFGILSEARQEMHRLLGISTADVLVGTVANFGVEKGYPHLIKTAALALEKNPALKFLFVGDGPLRAPIESEAVLLPQKARILFSGFRSDIPELINAMDIFVSASTVEGMPNSIYEAMACAKPVIATRVGGVPEILENERDALLINPGDEQALMDAILRLAADPVLQAKLGANARQKIETSFSMERMLDQYEKLYTQLL